MNGKSYINQLNWLQRAKSWIGAELFNEIIERSAKIVIINVIGALSLFISSYLLIHFSSEKIYGDYVIINIWINFFSVICLFGMDDYFVAILPKYCSPTTSNKNISSILLWAQMIFLVVYVLVIAFVILCSEKLGLADVVVKNQFLFLLILFELSLGIFLIHFLRGINKVEMGQWVEKAIRPGIFVLCISVIFVMGASFSLKLVLLIQACSLGVVLAILFFKVRPLYRVSNTRISFKRSCKSNFTFLGISLLNLLSTRLDIMYLAKQVLSQEVGYYNIAARLSDLVAYPLTAFNLIIPIFISKELHVNPQKTLGTIRKLMKISLAIMVVALVAAFVLGKTVLSFFGPNFVHSFTPFLLLCTGHLFSACAAPLNALLMVSGHQRLSLLCLIINVLTTFILCNTLVPVYGSIGAAISIIGGGFMNFMALLYISRSHSKNLCK